MYLSSSSTSRVSLSPCISNPQDVPFQAGLTVNLPPLVHSQRYQARASYLGSAGLAVTLSLQCISSEISEKADIQPDIQPDSSLSANRSGRHLTDTARVSFSADDCNGNSAALLPHLRVYVRREARWADTAQSSAETARIVLLFEREPGNAGIGRAACLALSAAVVTAALMAAVVWPRLAAAMAPASPADELGLKQR